MPHTFLPIETKEDSPEKLAAAGGKDTKFFLFSHEANALVNAVNFLHSAIVITQTDVDRLIAEGVGIELGEIETTALAFINAAETPYALGVSGVTFVTCIIDGFKKAYWFRGVPGMYGASAGTLQPSDLLLLFDEQTVSGPRIAEFVARWNSSISNFQIHTIQNTIGPNLNITGSQVNFVLEFSDVNFDVIPLPNDKLSLRCSNTRSAEDSVLPCAIYSPLGSNQVGVVVGDTTILPNEYLEIHIVIKLKA